MTTPHHLATLPFTSHQQQQQQHQHQQQRGMPYMQYMQQHGHQYVMQTHHQQQVPRLLTPPEDPQQQQQHFQYLKTAHALPFGPATAPRMMEHVHTASPAIEAYETFHGYLATVDDAWIILEACRQGLLRKVTDRPPSVRSTRTKKQSSTTTIRSGTIIVFDESRAQIKRWRDGLKWTASRISGAFLTYNERLSSDESNASPDSSDSCESSRLIKKTLAATLNGVKYHMVSYYTRGDLAAKRLETPSYWAAVNRLCLDKSRWSQAIIAGGWNSKTKRAPRAKAKALMQKPPVPSTTSPAALLTSVPISATIPTQSRMATPMITSPHLATPLMATPQMATPTPQTIGSLNGQPLWVLSICHLQPMQHYP
ncbi:Gti1/Pac2 family-domain-containing protein [Powellomyces hirtus]|nr:Gti1/Pac2 family-domain-containing protein [Powellomyces hirtus]